MEDTAMNKNIHTIIICCSLLWLPAICMSQQTIASKKRIQLSSKNLKQIRKEVCEWQQNWKSAEWGDDFPLKLADKNEFDSHTVVPYVRVYPDTLTKEIKHEYITDKTFVISKKKNVYIWYTKKEDGLSQLAIPKYNTKDFIHQLDSIGSDKQYYNVYFVNGTQYSFFCYQKEHLEMLLLYNEDGKDIFIDRHSKKYNSLKEIIDIRYGGVNNYIKDYKKGYKFGEDFIK